MPAVQKSLSLITAETYLLEERQATGRHEYVDGIVYAMAGASEAHNTITVNTVTELNLQFKRRPCHVYSNDMRVKVNAADYTYPDIVSVCGESTFEDKVFDTLLNPSVIMEVLSDSTADYDRGKKAELYRNMETLQEYVLIAQDRCHIEHYRRKTRNQWLLIVLTSLDEILVLDSIQAKVALSDIYNKVGLVA